MMICIECDSNALRGTSDIGCQRCSFAKTYSISENSCVCQAGFQRSSNVCFPSQDIASVPSRDNAIRISYDFVENRDTEQTGSIGQVVIQSETFEYLYFNASIGCSLYNGNYIKFNQYDLLDPKQCQILANMCVLQLYNELAVVCQIFQTLTRNTQLRIAFSEFYNDPGWRQGLPWIYYERATTDVLNTQRLRFRVSFGFENSQLGIINRLNYVLAKFDLEGNFLGFERLTDQLYVCETSNEEVERLMRFGTTVQKSCKVDLSRLISGNPFDMPKQANYFYEMYIQDYNGDLIDVPVLVNNFQNSDGARPNSLLQENEWQLTRRFFIFDTFSGISGDGTYQERSLPQYVRYPIEIKLRIALDPNKDEMIFTPLLEIQYRERSRNLIEQGFNVATAQFTSQYSMDTSGFWNACRIIFIILNIIFGVLLLIQMIVGRCTPQLSNDASAACKYAIVKLFVTAIDLYSYLFFWFLFAMAGYWFIFFKLQERVFILLPELNTFQQNYRPYAILFGIVASFKLLSMLYKILFEQCAFDVFFIDWERPKIPYEYQGETKMGVNAWRSLLLANEFNELQVQKIISTEFTLIIFALIMEGFGLRYFSTHDSVLSTEKKDSPENYVLQFFLTTLTIYVIGIIQYGLRYLIKFKVALNQEEFTDLCSVLNISVLMFDNSYHGYYIHGRSPYGQAEVTSEQLRKGLEYEESGQAQQRGLCADEPNLQTFEIYMPKRMLQDYKDHFMKDVKEEILKQNNDNTKRFNSVEVMLTNQKAIPKNLDLELVDDQKNFMNMIMQTYIEQVRTEPRKYIQDRSPIQRLLNLPANNNVNKGIPILFRDKWCQFANLFLFGLDFDFLMLDALTISFLDIAAIKNTTVDSRLLLGILIAYILDSFLVFLRGHFGQKNVAQHTLADERFLI